MWLFCPYMRPGFRRSKSADTSLPVASARHEAKMRNYQRQKEFKEPHMEFLSHLFCGELPGQDSDLSPQCSSQEINNRRLEMIY